MKISGMVAVCQRLGTKSRQSGDGWMFDTIFAKTICNLLRMLRVQHWVNAYYLETKNKKTPELLSGDFLERVSPEKLNGQVLESAIFHFE